MHVPDQSHINQVRDALWQRSGGASVMVGSGFSRSALNIRPDAKALPTWNELASEMLHNLYPQEPRETSAPDDPLQLAQEYDAAFGRGELHRFLQQLVRDGDFKPGDPHTRLLRLPWRDVFTTNWDTLLERARTSAAKYAYSVVRTMDEIPLANRPRIVKLHGSFPAYFPLIFTEEDYRTYPTKFAPFVNTVQQAMMESVFCLIGFSGNDPNFLQWSGWVRDNLGDAAPKIYLAGWLNLSTHQRRVLEDRNVVPIDLARHPKAGEWPEHRRHDYATEWLLHTLERGQPYDVTQWPSPPMDHAHPNPPTCLEPIEVVISDTPQEEPSPPHLSSKVENTSDLVRQIIKVWTQNRSIYPGWLFVPGSARFGLSWHTQEWEPRILQGFPNFTPEERLKAIYELVWRREMLLEPLSPELESAAEETLNLVDCQRRTIDGSAAPEIEWATVREAWRTIALALVTAARHRFDRSVFDQRIAAISPFLQDDPDVAHRIHHEHCLWAVYSLDFASLDGLLKDWQTENCDPVWMMRKAALLFEAGHGDEATALANSTLAAIREMPTDNRSLAGPSREGWALYLVARSEDWLALKRRWSELALLECNASMERRDIEDAIKGEGETEEAPSFDLGTRRRAILRFSNVHPQATAYRAIRLSEIAGLPPRSEVAGSLPVNIAADMLKRAAEKLSVSDSEMAIRLVLRVCQDDRDKTLMRVLSRPRVATLPVDLVKALAEICQRVIDYALPWMGGTRVRLFSWIGRMRVAIEALSRLVLRLEPARAEAIFDTALALYRNDHAIRHPWLSDPVRNLLQRSWEALPEERRTVRVLDVLGAPIVGVDNFAEAEARYPDLEELLILQDDLPSPVRTDDNEGRWQEIVGLLVRGLQAGGEARKRAASRIVSAACLERLTEAESSQVAQALWSEKYTRSRALPGETELLDWVFFLLPEPEPGLAEQRFRQKWLDASGLPQENAPSPDDILWEVGSAISGLKNDGGPVSLSDEEQSYLTTVVECWSETSVPHDSFPPTENQLRIPTYRALDGLPSVLAAIHIPESLGEKLFEKVQDLNQSKMPGFKLIAGLVKAIPNRLDEFSMCMRTGLAAEEESLVGGAAAGLHDWLTTSADADLRPPPDNLVHEIGVLIATRRKRPLGLALQIAAWVFDKGSDVQREAIRDLALQGLGSLAEELRYDREHAQDDNIDVPLLRWRSTQLAYSMAAHGSENAPAVSRWLEMAKEDPLPEVRYAKSPTLTHRS